MRIKRRIIQAIAEVDKKSAVIAACKLLGLDTVALDEDVWRTSEEGKHFKFDNETGEIKAGFGGKFNGKKLGGNWGGKKPSKGGIASNGEGYKIPGPERVKVQKTIKVPMTFGHYEDGTERKQNYQKEIENAYNSEKKRAEQLFSNVATSNEDKEQAVYKLFNQAKLSDAYNRAQEGISGEDLYGLGKVPKEWAARLTPTERDVLENIATEFNELGYREIDQWTKNNPNAEGAMYALQAKLLGAEIDSNLSDDVLKRYGGLTEEHTETPGQISMFWGENVAGGQETAGNGTYEASGMREAAQEYNAPPQSKYMKKMAKRREIASKWSEERKAEYAFREGFATEEEAVAAMENGTAQDLIDKYFDIMEENGDPTPTKPIKKQVPLLESYTHNDRINMIKDYTGMNDTEAENTYKALNVWFGNNWEKADTRAVDEYIDRDGAVAGQIYRGLHFTEDEYQSFMDSIKVGNRIGMRGKNSSWTNDKESAWHFSNGGERSVIIQCVKNKTSAPVDHLSHYGEEEVVAHSRTQWTVIGFVEGTNRTEIKVIECEDRMSDEDVARHENNDAMPEPKEKHEAQTFADRMNEENKYFVVIPRQETAEDGGPGSGNWGHRGRPGKRGGSGKGGGVQYRGGRSDVRYVGSRKDWMNGMTGENQQRASKFISLAKNGLSEKLNQKEKINKMASSGLLTFQEAEERIKQQNLDKISEESTPEEFVMKAGTKEQREELLNYVQSGRGWGEHADRLTQENWDENDRKLADVLCSKYGLRDVDGVNVPDDSNTQGWEEADLLYWYDLKAKAMELPTSGQEAPDELQYAAGIKERPIKSSNPWKNSISLMDASNALTKAVGRRVDPDTLLNGRSVSGEKLEDLEKEAFSRVFGNYQADRGLKHYLMHKMMAIGGREEFFKQARQYLTPDELSKVKEEMRVADRMGDNLFDTLDYRDQIERISTFALMNKAMGGPDCSDVVEKKKQEIEAEREEKRRAEEEYRKQAKERAKKAEKERQEAEARRKEELVKGITSATQSAEASGVKSNPPTKIEKTLTHDEIVSRIAGPDKTKGSCVSAAMTYVANKFGFDVLDFRGGLSQSIFAKINAIKDLADAPGVNGLVIADSSNGTIRAGTSEIRTAQEALANMEIGKEYILSCGRHCSIVRRNDSGQMEYLELQTSPGGYRPFTGHNGEFTLRNRFGCQRSRTIYGNHYETGAILIDIEKLKGCKAFENALQYINTNESEQMKGVGGSVK